MALWTIAFDEERTRDLEQYLRDPQHWRQLMGRIAKPAMDLIRSQPMFRSWLVQDQDDVADEVLLRMLDNLRSQRARDKRPAMETRINNWKLEHQRGLSLEDADPRDHTPFKGWLIGFIRWRLRDLRRSTVSEAAEIGVVLEEVLVDLASGITGPLTSAQRADLYRVIGENLRDASARDVHIFLSYVSDSSYTDIANQHGISADEAERIVRKLKQRLRSLRD